MTTALPQPQHPRRLLSGLALAALGAIAFSGKAIIVKLAYRHGVDAVTLIMYRMLFALPLFVLMAWLAGCGKPPLSARDQWGIVGLGISGYYLASMLDFAGLQYISASLERLILYLCPTLVMLLGWVLRGRRISRAQMVAVGVSYAGALLVFGLELRVAPTAATAWGALLVFASTCSYALYLFFSGEYVQRIGSLRLVGWATSFACLCCIGQFLLLRPLSAAIVAPEVLWLSLLNATLCTAAPVLLVMLAIERLGAALAAQVGMVGPLSTIALGILILQEPFTPWLAVGTALVIAGIGLFSRARGA
ncbi:MAG: DMT family transporter [Comamonadaceae bacterium]|nr:DMT family transporter [Comamonadaceae bacterium]